MQDNLPILLDPLRPDLRLEAFFPDGQSRSITSLLISIIADLPEVTVFLSSRYGLKTAFTCQRCHVKTEELIAPQIVFEEPRLSNPNIPPEIQLLTDSTLLEVYADVGELITRHDQEVYLKELNLRLPRSPLPSRYEFQLDGIGLLGSSLPFPHFTPFGISSVTK